MVLDVRPVTIADPAARLLGVEYEPCDGVGGTRMRLRFRYRTLSGIDAEGSGRVYLPAGVEPEARLPTVYNAGYALEEVDAAGRVRQGCVVATTDEPPEGLAWPGSHPLMRGPNLDIALLHVVRSLPFVDRQRLVVTGTSAGGWMTLLLAGESFPLNGVMPDVPIANWCYNASYFRHNLRRSIESPRRGAPRMTMWSEFCSVVDVCARALGDDTSGAAWWSLSPVAQLDTITCPVSTVFATSDMLVPIDQLGAELTRPIDPTRFHHGFTRDPGDFSSADSVVRRRLVEGLRPEQYTMTWLSVPDGALRLDVDAPPPADAYLRITVPDASTQWSIAVIDDGGSDPGVAHFKFALGLDRDRVLTSFFRTRPAADQLTLTKLSRLMDRCCGQEWMPCGITRLDYPEAERSDVLHGLADHCIDESRQVQFLQLYAQLDAERRALGEDLLRIPPAAVPGHLLSLLP